MYVGRHGGACGLAHVAAGTDTVSLLASRAAWLVLYPSVLALLLVAAPARLADLVADPGSTTFLRPAGGAYAVALFGLEVLVLCWWVANTLLIAWRRWNDWDWVTLWLSVCGLSFIAFALPELDALITADPRWAAPVMVAQWVGAAHGPMFLYLFPDGRIVPRRAAILVVIWPVIWALTTALTPGSFGLLTMPVVRLGVWITWITLSLAAPLYRFRSAPPTVRQQIKWVVLADFIVASSVVLVLAVRFLPEGAVPLWLTPVSLPLYIASLATMTLGFSVSMHRYRLLDIDVIISRTLVYGAATGALATTFFGGIVLLQALLRPLTGGDELAVAGSTLASVALARPLRAWIQRVVDRRFYRSRYDATRILDSFSATLSNEVDINAVRVDLIDAIEQTVQPAHVSVWLREGRQ